MHEEVIAAIPQEGGDTLLEVALLHNGAGSTGVELRYLIWGAGLGWYRQHTLMLDSAAARALLRTLGGVQRRLEQKTAKGRVSNVIPFPPNRQMPAATEQNASAARVCRSAPSTGSQG
jgi:fructose-1,6-bisphosphatase/inositol monophosphatase family enzyme